MTVLAYAFFARGAAGSAVISVAGPGGKAVNHVTVKVDGESRCTESPCLVGELEPKIHMIQVSAPGYAEMAPRAIKVEAGEESAVNIELVSPSAGTGISVPSTASGVKLVIDGKEIGPLPVDVTDLSPGSHTVELTGSPYFAPFKKTVNVGADEIVKLEPALELQKGQLRVELGSHADGAEILLVGGANKPAKLHKLDLPQNIDLPADTQYKVVARRAGYEEFEKTVSFSPEHPEITVVVALAPSASEGAASAPSGHVSSSSSGPAPAAASSSGQGVLNINSIPIANVIVDGKPMGSTPRLGVKVKAGNHTVVFVHPQKGRKVQQVKVGAGETKVVVARF